MLIEIGSIWIHKDKGLPILVTDIYFDMVQQKEVVTVFYEDPLGLGQIWYYENPFYGMVEMFVEELRRATPIEAAKYKLAKERDDFREVF